MDKPMHNCLFVPMTFTLLFEYHFSFITLAEI
ncbi:Hypothetical protein PAU_00885 [Photorhabdus asymbiotica]|uniref:Uncharacterized protein n=1 Tax=Photorhabdus asymbiotica subsp. asymbiotica (strain ATCC 43949 / 3105-77) TaxID=553480 RepID=C7BMZ1_PHOAA|nr:Hypothetical protein PAU_00885 [Photorhabdus asymbiotica]